MDTIYALSTAPGKAGVAIIRVSGPGAFEAAKGLCGDVPQSHKASLRWIRDRDGNRIDQAVLIVFNENQSFTGEPVAEFHVHGSVAVIQSVLTLLGGFADFRPAEPGEFTRRALINGRLDIAQVEGLADLIDAETEAQRAQAQRVFAGALGELVGDWRRQLIRAAALIEATIDFADEEVPEDVFPEVRELLETVSTGLSHEVARSQVSERIRTGFEVAIIGPPNIGKSTLLNRLAGREAAITSEYAGTTRDVIEVRMDLNGLPVTLLDTAGLRDTDDHVESIGIDRTRERADQADLRIFLGEKGAAPDLEPRPDDLLVIGKADQGVSGPGLGVSGKTGVGLPELIGRIGEILGKRSANAGLAIRERHRVAMTGGLEAIGTAISAIERGTGDDLVAEEIRTAIRALDSVIGRVDVEMVLDEIFSSFCLGK